VTPRGSRNKTADTAKHKLHTAPGGIPRGGMPGGIPMGGMPRGGMPRGGMPGGIPTTINAIKLNT
jgi:hypothetical protein